MMPSRCYIQYVSKSVRPSSGHKTGPFLIPIPKKGSTEECANHWTVALISHASKVMLKIFHAKLQHYANQKLSDVQAGFRKGRNQRSNCQHSLDHRESKENSQKNIYSVSSTMLKPLTVWIITNCGKLLKR